MSISELYDLVPVLDELETLNRQIIRHQGHPAAYSLRFEDDTFYFGSTKDVWARYLNHRSVQQEPFRFKIWCIGDLPYVCALEKKLIRRYKATGRLRNIHLYNPPTPPPNKGIRNGSSLRNRLKKSGSPTNYRTIRDRIKHGETFEEALDPRNRRVRQWVEFEGEQWPIKKLAEHLGMAYQSLCYRIEKGIHLALPKSPGKPQK